MLSKLIGIHICFRLIVITPKYLSQSFENYIDKTVLPQQLPRENTTQHIMTRPRCHKLDVMHIKDTTVHWLEHSFIIFNELLFYKYHLKTNVWCFYDNADAEYGNADGDVSCSAVNNIPLFLSHNLKAYSGWLYSAFIVPKRKYTTGKKYGIFCISAIFCIFVVHKGCFFVWNIFLRVDITFWGADSQLTAKWTAKFENYDFGLFTVLDSV